MNFWQKVVPDPPFALFFGTFLIIKDPCQKVPKKGTMNPRWIFWVSLLFYPKKVAVFAKIGVFGIFGIFSQKTSKKSLFRVFGFSIFLKKVIKTYNEFKTFNRSEIIKITIAYSKFMIHRLHRNHYSKSYIIIIINVIITMMIMMIMIMMMIIIIIKII